MESKQLREWTAAFTDQALYHLAKQPGKLRPAAFAELKRRNKDLMATRVEVRRQWPWMRGGR